MIFDTASIKEFLSTEFTNRVKRNDRYSLRAFAKNLGLSPGELSELLNGKRSLSLNSAAKITKAMGLNESETEHLVKLSVNDKAALRGNGLKTAPKQINKKSVKDDVFQLLSDWYYFALINLMDCKGFQWSVLWISRRLGITRAQARLAMDLLLKVGLVTEKNGRFIVNADFVYSPDGIPSSAVRNYHRQMLEKSIQALETQKQEDRDITGLGFAVDPKHIPAIKKEIAQFHEKLTAQFSKGNRTQVYHLETALIRLSEGETYDN